MKRKENNGSNISGMIKNFIKESNSAAKVLIKSSNFTMKLPEFMYVAVYYGNLEMVQYLLSEGASLTSVPKSMKPEGDSTDESVIHYREAPYIILASSRGFMYYLFTIVIL